MASSGVYNFSNISAADLVVNAFGRIGIRRAALQPEHMLDASTEANLLQVEISNRQPLWWTLEEVSQTLTADDPTYDLAGRVISIIAAYISTTVNSTVTDRIIMPISVYDYAAIPNKTQSGVPTVYKFERLITPRITLWQPPDDETTYTLKLQCLCQPEDVSLPSGTNVDAPYRFLDVFASGLSHRLARLYRPEMEQARFTDYQRAWDHAANQDQEEGVGLFIVPALEGYQD